MHGVGVDVDVVLGGGEAGMAHDLLDHRGRDIFFCQGRGCRVAAGVRRQAAASGGFHGFVVDLVYMGRVPSIESSIP